MLKKINGLCSWLLILALFGHLATMTWSLLTGWYDYNICKALAGMTAGICAVHIAISMIILCFFTDGSDFRCYQNHNIKIILQRASGLVIIALLHLHIKAFGFIVTGAQLSAGVKFETIFTEFLFFGSIFTHLAVSFSRSMIGIGLVRSAETEKKFDRVVYIICLALFLLVCFALLRFVVQWTGFAG